MRVFGYWTLFIALCISAVAAYYSIIGLTAIFAAAVIPIIIMGSVLEVAKITTAVWLHRYWSLSPYLMRIYLTTAVVVLMFITSMGIFGFLSKAHIEQTAAAEEGVAQLDRIDADIARYNAIIARAEERIVKAEESTGTRNTDIQTQIDKEQERIDTAYDRAQPAIDEQIAIIDAQTVKLNDKVAVYEQEINSLDQELTRLNNLVAQFREELSNTNVASVEEQVQPYIDQIAQLDNDIARLDEQAAAYEARIAELEPDNSAVDTLKAQIANIEESIVVTTNKLQSTERDKIREGQAVIGVTSDGLFGGNTRRALEAWVTAQQDRIASLQAQETDLRAQAQLVVDNERNRLTGLVTSLRGEQTAAVQDRKQALLDTIDTIRGDAANSLKTQQQAIQDKIDNVLTVDIPTNRQARKSAQDSITALQNSEDPKVKIAREEIARIRDSVNEQIVQSNNLIADLRNSLTVGEDSAANKIIEEQQEKIVQANNSIDTLTENKYALQAEARKLEAEVGPVKYIAELVYGEDTSRSSLEDAVRWVILLLVAVFDPLAVILVLAGVMTVNRFGKHKEPPSIPEPPGEAPKKPEPEVELKKEEHQELKKVKKTKRKNAKPVDIPAETNSTTDTIDNTSSNDSVTAPAAKPANWTPTRNKMFWLDEHKETVKTELKKEE